MSVNIDSRAVVGKKAHLGENVSIGPYAIIGDDVVLGDGTTIAAYGIVQDGARLGKGCKVASFSVIGGPPQDLKYKGEPTVLIVGDNCDIREYVTLNRGTVETGKTTIGNNCMFMANTHVAHDCRVGDNCIFANSVPLAGHVVLGNWVVLGGLSAVHQFVHIGDHVMLGALYKAAKDIPPFVRAGRDPVSYEGLNSVGLRRRGLTAEAIDLIDKAYTLIYNSGLNVSQAVARIKAELPKTAEIQNILDFIANSKRGIIPGPRHQ
jgi:UDP-N-acetylglucosamine acyltransferase